MIKPISANIPTCSISFDGECSSNVLLAAANALRPISHPASHNLPGKLKRPFMKPSTALTPASKNLPDIVPTASMKALTKFIAASATAPALLRTASAKALTNDITKLNPA